LALPDRIQKGSRTSFQFIPALETAFLPVRYQMFDGAKLNMSFSVKHPAALARPRLGVLSFRF